jgi:phospholipid-binding lipoprotein MlaA
MKGTNFYFFLIFSFFSSFAFAADDSYYDEFEAFEQQMQVTRVEIYDPLEPLNRKIFIFNDVADEYLVGYVVDVYRFITPKIVRTGISNFFRNIKMPFSIMNSALQGKFDNSLSCFSSFVINSTVGLLGFIDVASQEGVRYNNEDFGQTLAFYNIGSGPYLILPFLGPSTVRDFSGDIFHRVVSPTSVDYLKIKDIIGIKISDENLILLNSVDLINKRESLSAFLEDTKSSSFDYYSAIRSYYFQNRNANINE